MNMNTHRDSSSLLRARSPSAAVAFSGAGLVACLDGEDATLSFTPHVVAPSRAPGAGAGAARAPPTRLTSLTLIAVAARASFSYQVTASRHGRISRSR
ncbi:hypothetical protein GUJ93_ZPchr0008g13049 [Zizania palustris]|uniref:Uncharacterized protein n=1 Tax=Zizania palustris TaxID=103762 RepID=A0A8J5RIZ7_ZIZPA|nr:hypothetical protein GUJ93_ZPchr0008g13049 [Zizania palustris]